MAALDPVCRVCGSASGFYYTGSKPQFGGGASKEKAQRKRIDEELVQEGLAVLRAAGRRGASAGTEDDRITHLYGTAQPSHIPESSAWWERQAKDLSAITDDSENGMMQSMVTVTHNDACPEMLAAIRRGPMSQPTDEEVIEYLLQRKRRDQERPGVCFF